MNIRTRFLALPLLTAGILAGALGLAGTASADSAPPSSDSHAAATAQHPKSEPQAQRHHHHRRHEG
ncbi:hypothetical protein BST22_21110 [Mycolicibacterium chubuense]|uniref:Uncharacterized protein n=1 Tax=Mycolicibacterium chubuense TaxID=1800 RepID=A0A0J6VTE8_MYCCU|nr:hypothetical protein [Mycolicibacterium chubuense]KMO72748.1 hypothetical protein MCHUDSM44219_04734 [Mycolicibacterium chubuense]ORA46744.1 hypothetical protein BST22_21110 [Mycolicibacterium chubuense]SPX99746.1 Uncharacterised protein [Mycolicibacterium chubuense]